MKWNNPVVVFDLETTDAPDDRRIIELGAVYLDRDLEHQSSFRSLVNPEGFVSPFVQDLTGYTQFELNAAPALDQVASKLVDWVAAHGNIKQARLAAWGNYFDVNVLRQEFARTGVAYPFSGTCLDVKTAALMWCALAGKRTDKLSVSLMMDHLGLSKEGVRFHHALDDALATANIFRRVMADIGSGVWVDAGGYKQYVRVAADG
jgi:DNA polymerase III epsilon subunit-like protein